MKDKSKLETVVKGLEKQIAGVSNGTHTPKRFKDTGMTPDQKAKYVEELKSQAEKVSARIKGGV